MMGRRIDFDVSQSAWSGYEACVRTLASRPGVRSVLEIGGGANPTLPADFVEEEGLEYVVLDVSSDELAKAPDGYTKVHADITSPNLDIEGDYDLIFSRMVAEHVPDGRRFHGNVLRLLADGGIAFHFFPTLYAPPYVVNRLLPERLSERALSLLQPGRESEGKHAKFPSYYDWCRGPSQRQIGRFERLGYRVEEYIGFFGHGGYYGKIKPLKRAHERLALALARHPIPWLTSFSYVVLSKKHEP